MESPCRLRLKQALWELAPVDPTAWNGLSHRLYSRPLKRLEHFSIQGDYAQELAFVCQGVLRAYGVTEGGEEWNKHFFVEEDFFMAAIAPHQQSDMYIQALTPVSLLCISLVHLEELINRYRALEPIFLRLALNYLEKKHRKESLFLAADAKEKYLFFRQLYPSLEERIPQYQIARFLGITPIQLSRIRRNLCSKDR